MLIDKQGFEIARCFFTAEPRDCARLGRLLAHDGSWNGKQIVDKQWIIDGTTVRASDAYLAPGKASPGLGYGYLMSLWESAENFDRDKRRRAFTISMSKVETIVSIRSRVGIHRLFLCRCGLAPRRARDLGPIVPW